MTEQASSMWFWTVVIGGIIWLGVGFVVARWLGVAVGLGSSTDERRHD